VAEVTEEPTSPGLVTLSTEPPDSAAGRAAHAMYLEEVRARFPPGAADRLAPVLPQELTPPRGVLVVVRRGDEVAGCGGVRRLSDDVAEVKRVFLSPALRGRGVARLLMERLHDEARNLGCGLVRLDTAPSMPEARRLYLALGYAEIPDYNGNPNAAHWFERAV
jgi:GNAT superfamily N-acetyltransferase